MLASSLLAANTFTSFASGEINPGHHGNFKFNVCETTIIIPNYTDAAGGWLLATTQLISATPKSQSLVDFPTTF